MALGRVHSLCPVHPLAPPAARGPGPAGHCHTGPNHPPPPRTARHSPATWTTCLRGHPSVFTALTVAHRRRSVSPWKVPGPMLSQVSVLRWLLCLPQGKNLCVGSVVVRQGEELPGHQLAPSLGSPAGAAGGLRETAPSALGRERPRPPLSAPTAPLAVPLRRTQCRAGANGPRPDSPHWQPLGADPTRPSRSENVTLFCAMESGESHQADCSDPDSPGEEGRPH